MNEEYDNTDLYSEYTRTLHDTLIDNPTLLDFMKIKNSSGVVDENRTKLFKDTFISLWDIYEIGSETLDLFVLNLTNTFNLYSKYYSERLEIYEDNLVTLDDLIKSEYHTEFYELPNSQTQSEYVTNKNKSRNYDYRLKLEQREALLKSIKNIYLEFAYQFKECFCQLFGSYSLHNI